MSQNNQRRIFEILNRKFTWLKSQNVTSQNVNKISSIYSSLWLYWVAFYYIPFSFNRQSVFPGKIWGRIFEYGISYLKGAP